MPMSATLQATTYQLQANKLTVFLVGEERWGEPSRLLFLPFLRFWVLEYFCSPASLACLRPRAVRRPQPLPGKRFVRADRLCPRESTHRLQKNRSYRPRALSGVLPRFVSFASVFLLPRESAAVLRVWDW